MSKYRFLLVAPFLVFLSACGGSSGDSPEQGVDTQGGGPGDSVGTDDADDPTETPETPEPPEPPELTGEFTLSIDDEIGENNGGLLDEYLRPRLEFVNNVAMMPTDIPVSVTFCGFANAFYISELNDGPEIIMCVELADEIYNFYDTMFPEDPGSSTEFALSAYSFIMQHEMAHAFDEQLELPIIGNVESGADSIATVLSVEQGLGELAVYAAVLFDSSEDGSFGAIHPGGADRSGDLSCWAIGGDQGLVSIFPQLVSDLILVFAEAGRDCVAEYAGLRSDVIRWLPDLESSLIASFTGGGINSYTHKEGALLNIREEVRTSWTVSTTVDKN